MFNQKKDSLRDRLNKKLNRGYGAMSRPRVVSKNNNLKRFLPRRQNPLIAKIRAIILLILIGGGIVFLTYSIFFSGFFNVKTIHLVNKEIENQILSGEIEKTVKKSIGENIIFTDTKALEEKILKSFPELENVIVDKNYPDTLDISFSEYPLVANILYDSKNLKKTYIVNSVGFIMKEDYENKSLPYIRVKTDEAVNKKSAAIAADKLTYILDAKKYFEEKFGMRVKECEYRPVARELRLLTERDFYLWLDMQVSFEKQFKKLKKALVKLDIFKENFEYIDLRIAGNNGDKIIYKRK